MEELYLCADVGGTQIKTGLLTAAGELVGDIHRADAQANLPRVPLLDHMAHCLLTTAQTAQTVRGIRIAMPGPFDYGAGICKMEGLEKYGALYNVNVREELEHRLRPVLGQAAADVRMQNDVASFALGELPFGRAQGAARGLFLCIGTGCGSAFTIGSCLAPAGTPGMPENGYVYPLPLRGKRMDDWISRRGLQELSRRYMGRPLDGLALAQSAAAGDTSAQKVWQVFGEMIAEALVPILDRFLPEVCCLGGQVTASSSLFLGPLQQACLARNVELFCTQDTSLRAMQGALLGESPYL